MDTTTQKPNYKTIENDKDFFSAYMNMARHNAYLVLSYITETLGKSPAGEDSLTEMFAVKVLEDNKRPDLALKSIEKLDKHFPFLRPIFDNDEKFKQLLEKQGKTVEIDLSKAYFNALTALLKQLNTYRNFYTHPVHSPIETNKKIFFYLNSTFDASVRLVKTRFNLEETQLSHLRRYMGKNENSKFYYKFEKGENEISEKGLAFFICLFLEKKYVFQFLKKLKGFKADNTPQALATLESYCVYRLHIPQLRVESTDPSMGLALDMLNELKRCPGQLYDLLPAKDQDKFRVKITDANDDDVNENDYSETVSLVRKNDRFPYIALSYIDKLQLFSKIRFHVDLGNYFYKFYSKTSVDGEEHTRSLKKELKTFGRLGDLISLKQTEWKDLIKPISERKEGYDQPYITDTVPHYHICPNHTIGLKIVSDDKALLPVIDGKNTRTVAPDFWLSIYELPGLVFYTMLGKNDKQNLGEELLLNYKKQVTRFFSDVKNGVLMPVSDKVQLAKLLKEKYQIEYTDIPEKLEKYLLGKISVNESGVDEFTIHAEAKIERMIAETKRRQKRIEHDLERIRDSKNKPGKKGWVEIKSGRLADFLATDMLQLQESKADKGKDKITGLNFQVLQSRLAFYGRDKHLLADIFKQCRLTGSDNTHPFLHKIDPVKHNDIVSFYKAYLTERINYLNKCKQEKHFRNYYFLKPNSRRWAKKNDGYFNSLFGDYLDFPINLPRGLFKDALVDWFNHNGSAAMKQLIQNSKSVNTVFLIQKYLELDCNNDCPQEFYEFKRTYRFINKLFEKRGRGNVLEKKFYNTEEFIKLLPEIKAKIEATTEKGKDGANPKALAQRDLLAFSDNEKVIRYTKTSDVLLFLMAKDILYEQGSGNLNHMEFKLSQVKPDADTGLLSQQVSFSMPIANKTIIREKLKVKNYGDFRRFVKDRRLPGLFQWINESQVMYETLEKELEQYDRARLEIANIIYRFETAANSYFKLQVTNGYIKNSEILDSFYKAFPKYEDERDLVKCIRNAFSHNEYPKRNELPTVDAQTLPQVAEGLKKLLNEKIGKYLNLLENN